MAWVATAIIGSAVVGAGASIYAGSKSATAASRASAAQSGANAANLQFQQQQYDDWQAVYGPVQDNLSQFYQHLTPDSLVASGLKNYEQQYQAVQQNLQRSFTQRGIDSPAQGLLNQQAALAGAEYKANLRNDAPLKAAQLKQGFIDHNVQNPSAAGISNQLSNQAAFYGQQAGQYNQQSAAGYRAAGQAIQGGVSGYVQNQQYQQLMQQNQQNQQTIRPTQSQPVYAAPLPQQAPWKGTA